MKELTLHFTENFELDGHEGLVLQGIDRRCHCRVRAKESSRTFFLFFFVRTIAKRPTDFLKPAWRSLSRRARQQRLNNNRHHSPTLFSPPTFERWLTLRIDSRFVEKNVFFFLLWLMTPLVHHPPPRKHTSYLASFCVLYNAYRATE